MEKKPKLLLFVSMSLVLVAFFVPFQIALTYELALTESEAIIGKLTWINWSVMGGALMCAVLVDRVSKWALFVLPPWLLIAGLNNWVVGYYGSNDTLIQAALATLGLVFLLAPLYRSSTVELFLNPGRCWWKRADRTRLHIPVSVFTGLRNASLVAETFDISESGVFIPCATELVNEENLLLDFYFAGETQWSCRARVVRRASARGMYPPGIGVEFIEMNWRRRRRLRQLIHESMA